MVISDNELIGKMKKRLIFLLIGAIVCMLSACGQRENIEHTQANISNNVISSEGVTDDEEEEIAASDNVISSEGVTDDVEKEITASGNVTSSEGVTDDVEEEIAASDNVISSEGVTDDVEEEITASDNVTSSEGVTDDVEEITASDNVADDLIVNELEKLAGEYEYLSDYGVGRLIIEKNEYAYDISDYESQSSYRFLADSSNIESIANNRIYIKYPEQVFQDDTVIFCYYILEYGEDEMNVYYRQSEQADEQFLYHATKKN